MPEARDADRFLGRSALWFVVAAIMIALGAYGAGTRQRSGPPGDESAEAGFARDMAVHHAQAVEMGEAIRFRTADPELRALATDIVLAQQTQIGQMTGWLDVWGLPATGRRPAMAWMGHPGGGRMPGMASAAEIATLREAPPAEAEVLFLQAMIRHHQGGVAMAEALLARSRRTEVRRLAEKIVAGQQKEIRAMTGLLNARGVAPPGRS